MSRPRVHDPGVVINVILDPRVLDAIKEFQHRRKLPSRMEAIRQLLNSGLALHRLADARQTV
jgi:hypothetical protein